MSAVATAVQLTVPGWAYRPADVPEGHKTQLYYRRDALFSLGLEDRLFPRVFRWKNRAEVEVGFAGDTRRGSMLVAAQLSLDELVLMRDALNDAIAELSRDLATGEVRP